METAPATTDIVLNAERGGDLKSVFSSLEAASSFNPLLGRESQSAVRVATYGYVSVAQ